MRAVPRRADTCAAHDPNLAARVPVDTRRTQRLTSPSSAELLWTREFSCQKDLAMTLGTFLGLPMWNWIVIIVLLVIVIVLTIIKKKQQE